jgi:hypothetical protein
MELQYTGQKANIKYAFIDGIFETFQFWKPLNIIYLKAPMEILSYTCIIVTRQNAFSLLFILYLTTLRSPLDTLPVKTRSFTLARSWSVPDLSRECESISDNEKKVLSDVRTPYTCTPCFLGIPLNVSPTASVNAPLRKHIRENLLIGVEPT